MPGTRIPSTWDWGTPSLEMGYTMLGTGIPPGKYIGPVTGVPPRKDMGPVDVLWDRHGVPLGKDIGLVEILWD